MSGGDKSPKPGHGLLAAIVTTPAGPWFFKVTGPEKAIAAQRATFDSFLKTLTLPGQPKKAEPAAKKTAAAQDTESVKQSAKKTAKKTEKAAAKVPAAAPKKAY